MNFIPSNLKEVKDHLTLYFKELAGGCDDFFEENVLGGKFYKIMDGTQWIGSMTVTKEGKLSSLYVIDSRRPDYQKIFDEALLVDHIQGIFTVTSDTKMMNQIIRRNLPLVKQAYNFSYKGPKQVTTIAFRQAQLKDLPLMEPAFGDFFEDYEKKINHGDLYLGYENDTLVSLGNMTTHALHQDTASIGMIVKEDQRQKGYGTETIKSLINICLEKGYHVHAGCWYYNHGSRKTLLASGMHTSCLIVRVDNI